MKKILWILIALPMLLASCNNDDLPDVKFNVNIEGGTEVDGVIYVVQGQELQFTSISVTPVNSKHTAAIASAAYFWDFIPSVVTIQEPFARAFDTALYSVGAHEVQIKCQVLEVDCTPAYAMLSFPIRIVEDASEIPDGGEVNPTMIPDPIME